MVVVLCFWKRNKWQECKYSHVFKRAIRWMETCQIALLLGIFVCWGRKLLFPLLELSEIHITYSVFLFFGCCVCHASFSPPEDHFLTQVFCQKISTACFYGHFFLPLLELCKKCNYASWQTWTLKKLIAMVALRKVGHHFWNLQLCNKWLNVVDFLPRVELC